MAFAGTTQKCMACDKTVYLVDKLTADNRVYHKACFRCHHCRGTLKLGNYNSFEGVLYCRPHFDQLFKRTGSLDKSFEGTPKIVKPEKPVDSEKPISSKVSTMFAGTRDKCFGCKNTVYPTEKVSVNGTPYHKSCFKCIHGGCTISPSNYIAHEGRLYCKHHHNQLIKEKGNLSQLEGDIEKDSMNDKTNGREVSSLDIRGHGHTSKDKLPAQTTVSSLSSGKDGFDYAISAGSTSPVKLSVVSFFICAFILEAASSYFVRPLRQASTALSIPWKFVFDNICSASNKCNIFRH
ncbi:LIM DOMAIN-CONTAINING PROTEIN WLIM1-LIKE [Salix purpurea]|uniref:LIM DOMAIN-CONTAINING PROTEIN WLIM1-LIKE n=1 Tax=Salix purpurea TaxID=77065 RepID=A0A9Q0SQL6_SALPP|nr:LIM DOMAIN-CONTAINING PROTEIN WLIM1-LIKE [Salix purpurea]